MEEIHLITDISIDKFNRNDSEEQILVHTAFPENIKAVSDWYKCLLSQVKPNDHFQQLAERHLKVGKIRLRNNNESEALNEFNLAVRLAPSSTEVLDEAKSYQANATLMIPPKYVQELPQPYEKYTTRYPEMSKGSVACSLLPNKSGTKQIFANRIIPKGKVIMAEMPFVSELLSMPNLQCEVCQQTQNAFITCNECHIPTYCSAGCQESDFRLHQYECEAMRMMLFPLLDGRLVLRLLVRGLMFLQENVFKDVDLRQFTSAQDLLQYILELKTYTRSDYLNILKMNPMYGELPINSFDFCIKSTLFLTQYINDHTLILKEFFKDIDPTFSKTFISILILRHYSQLTLKAIKIGYEVYDNNVWKKHFQPHLEFSASENMFDYNLMSMKMKMRDNLSYLPGDLDDVDENLSKSDINHSVGMESITQPCNYYRHFVLNIIKESISMISINSQMYKLIENYTKKMYEHIETLGTPRNQYFNQTIRGVYPNVTLFKHSCAPNANIVLIEPGILVVKTLEDLNFGDQIYLSYGPNSSINRYEVRANYLKKIGLHCSCSDCRNQSNKKFDFKCSSVKCRGTVNLKDSICMGCQEKVNLNAIRRYEYEASMYKKEKLTTVNELKYNLLMFVFHSEIYDRFNIRSYISLCRVAFTLVSRGIHQWAYEAYREIHLRMNQIFPKMSSRLLNEYLKHIYILIPVFKLKLCSTIRDNYRQLLSLYLDDFNELLCNQYEAGQLYEAKISILKLYENVCGDLQVKCLIQSTNHSFPAKLTNFDCLFDEDLVTNDNYEKHVTLRRETFDQLMRFNYGILQVVDRKSLIFSTTEQSEKVFTTISSGKNLKFTFGELNQIELNRNLTRIIDDVFVSDTDILNLKIDRVDVRKRPSELIETVIIGEPISLTTTLPFSVHQLKENSSTNILIISPDDNNDGKSEGTCDQSKLIIQMKSEASVINEQIFLSNKFKNQFDEQLMPKIKVNKESVQIGLGKNNKNDTVPNENPIQLIETNPSHSASIPIYDSHNNKNVTKFLGYYDVDLHFNWVENWLSEPKLKQKKGISQNVTCTKSFDQSSKSQSGATSKPGIPSSKKMLNDQPKEKTRQKSQKENLKSKQTPRVNQSANRPKCSNKKKRK